MIYVFTSYIKLILLHLSKIRSGLRITYVVKNGLS